jgi:hypothetical protein
MKKIIYLLIIIFVISGCTKKEEEKQIIIPIEEPIIEETLKIMDPSSKSRPIAIMINNHPVARPNHSGLQDAYLIYEIIVEGGFTRYLALYKDQETKRIGSVRSARPYFLDYAMENDAIYVHFGGSDQSISEIVTFNINNVNVHISPGAFRDRTLGVAYEHTAFTTLPDLKKVISNRNYRNTSENKLLDYSIEPINKEGEPANKIILDYSQAVKVEYNYNELTKTYDRKVNGVDHIDGVTKNIYNFKNIIVYQLENRTIDSYGRQELRNIIKTNGYYITEGKVMPIIVEKNSRTAKTTYKYNDETDIILNDGNTFIQIVPTNRNIEIN